MLKKLQHIRKHWRSRLSGDSAVHEEIGAVYRRLLGRDPNEHEVLHWTTMAGEEMDYVVDSIMTSPEYQQKTSAQQKVLVELERFKIYVMENDLDVGRNLLKTSVHEPHITRVFADTLKGGDVFLDLGANLGYFSLLAATLVGKSGKVIAFEPNGQNLQLLYSSIIENQFENIKVHPVAASDSPQILKLTSFGSNGYLEAAPIGNSNFQLVQAVVADELLDSEPRLDMVKMDIEGYETLALRGLDRTIKKHKPVIITEFSPWHIKHRCGVDPQGYLMQISEYGYNLSMIEPSGTIRSASSAESLMDYWHSFNSETQHLDLIAHPV